MSKRKKDETFEFAEMIAHLCLIKQAEDVVILDLREITSMTDYFVICSGQLKLQVKAIADAVLDGLEEERIKPWHTEGYNNLKWVLLDFSDVVVHIFTEDARRNYQLEELWGDSPVTKITDTYDLKNED